MTEVRSRFNSDVHLQLVPADVAVPQGHVRPVRSRITRPALPSQSGTGNVIPDFEPPAAFQDPSQVPLSVAPVIVPSDPNGVLTESHAARELLANDALVIVR